VPDPIYSIHCWLSRSYWTARFPPTSIRRWHTGIWLVQTIWCRRLPGAPVCVCRRHRRVDAANHLQLNTGKTELLWCTTSRRRQQLPTSSLRIGSASGWDLVNPSASVRDLGVYFDADLCMRCYVHKTIANWFAVLRQLRSIRRSVPTSVYTRRSLSPSSCHGCRITAMSRSDVNEHF